MDGFENVVVQSPFGNLGRRGGRRSYFQPDRVGDVEGGLGMKDQVGTSAVLKTDVI
jgi:hypothetical protein